MRASEVDLIIKPLLSGWPEQDKYAEYLRSPFKVSAFKTLPMLKAELAHLEARDVVIYTSHERHMLRQDGWVRSDRAPRDPGVILTFKKQLDDGRWEELRFPCRTFELWEDNLRAITLALEALRKVDRYGVTSGAQYTGYRALPPAALGSQEQTPEQAAEFIASSAEVDPVSYSGLMLEDLALAEHLYKRASKRLHPDVEGGSSDAFAKLENSISVLRDKASTNGHAEAN